MIETYGPEMDLAIVELELALNIFFLTNCYGCDVEKIKDIVDSANDLKKRLRVYIDLRTGHTED